MVSSIFATRFREALEQKKMKQIELVRLAEAQGIKLGKSQLSQYLSGKTLPRKDMLQFLASVLEKDAAWLLGKETTSMKGSDEDMRKFNKSKKLDNVLYDVRGPVVEEAARMEEEGTQVLKLNIGNPAPFGFQAPDEVIYDMRRQLTKCEGYSDSKGLFSARKAIMQYAQLKHIPNVTIDNIYTGNGVSELINLSMSALLDSGDEVLIPSPDYPLWTACVTLAGGTASQGDTSGPQGIVGRGNQHFVTGIQQRGHRQVDQLTDTVAGVDIVDGYIGDVLELGVLHDCFPGGEESLRVGVAFALGKLTAHIVYHFVGCLETKGGGVTDVQLQYLGTFFFHTGGFFHHRTTNVVQYIVQLLGFIELSHVFIRTFH